MPQITINVTDDYTADLKKRLDKYGISPAELSRATGISESQFSKWFNTNRQPRVQNIAKIEQAIMKLRTRKDRASGK